MSCHHENVTVAWSGDCAKIVCLDCGQVEYYNQEAEESESERRFHSGLELALMLGLTSLAAFFWTQNILDWCSK